MSGTTHHELDRDDGYSYVGSDVVGDVTAVATSVASKAAVHASLMAKAYEKLVVPTFPASGEMTNWMIHLGLSCVCVGFSDELEVAWLAACSSKAFEELNFSGWSARVPPMPYDTLDRWRKLDFALAKALHGILKQSKESLTEDVILKTRECAQSNSILKGRQIVWMMLDYFKTNRTLQEQYKYPAIESLKWMGDERLPQFYKRWKVITTGMAIPLDDRILCDIFVGMHKAIKEACFGHP